MNLTKVDNESNKFTMSFLQNSYADSVPELNFEESRKNWVEWGVKDAMPKRLFELYNQSGFHRAIIDAKVSIMLGDGVEQDISENPESKRTQQFINNPNLYEDMNSIFSKLSYDFELFGLAYIEIIYSVDRTSIASINHIDASKIRWGKKVKNHLTHVYYCQDWSKQTKYKPVPVPIFNPAIKADYPTQIIPIIRYTPMVDYYTLPSYYSVIKWISIDFEISNFHENNIKNGFTPTIFFDFPTDATEKEMETIKNKINEKYKGTQNAGGVIFGFHPPGTDNEVKVTVLSVSDADKQYEWLKKTTQQEILVGHKVTNENLVGISTPGKLGSSTELLQSYELYYNTVVEPDIHIIVDKLNVVMQYNGMNDIMIVKNTPLSNTYSENTLAQILTKDELREQIGYEPIDSSLNLNKTINYE